MNSIKIFGDVVLYLEKTIVDGEEIDYGEISKIAASPAALFQRIFVFVSGISISDYVRKRKLTLAGFDLVNKDMSIVELALKYGFQSHSAFTRAFKEHHCMTPSEAKRSPAKLNNYLPINFSDMRFIGGQRVMAEMKKITYKETPERLFVGYQYETDSSKEGEVWQVHFNSDAYEKLRTLSESDFCCDDIDPCDSIALLHNFKGKDNYSLIIGDYVKPGTVLPEGFSAKYLPKGEAAYIQIEGNNLHDVLNSGVLLINEAIEKTGRQIDYEHFYWCMVYTLERYCEPLKRGEKIILDYVVPVK